MKTKLAVFAVLACVLAPWGAVPASAQSLAEAAAKERERRKGKTTKVVTEAELRSSGRQTATPPELVGEEGAPAGSASPAPGAKPAGEGEAPPKTDEELRAEKKTDLEKRLKMQNDIIAATRKMMDEVQLELNDTGNLTFGGRREALMKIMDEHKQEIAQAEAAIEQIREEARRAGIALSS